ncbi:unnamed protein product, partial [Didymodactylos carnosus]
ALPVEKGPGCDSMYCQHCKAPFRWDQMETAIGGKNAYKIEQAKRNASKWVSKDLPKDSIQLFVVLLNGKSKAFTICKMKLRWILIRHAT